MSSQKVERHPAVPAGHEYTCAISTCAGFEDHILRLRNANRDQPQDARYVRWRYERSPGAPEPKIFWLLSPAGERVGMASVIYRPYWIDGVRTQLAVLGDISLDARLRGKGLGHQLLAFVTRYLADHAVDGPAMVIPTEAARKTLESIGWTTAGTLVPHVLLADPYRKLHLLLRSGCLARGTASICRIALRGFLRLHVKSDCLLTVTEDVDASCEALWERTAKAGTIVREMGVQALRWRYASHPDRRFHVARFASRSGELLGCLVFELDLEEGTCAVYDLLIGEGSDVSSMLALFALYCMKQDGCGGIRIVVNDRHPLASEARRLGFMPRKASTVFQVYSPNEPLGERWSMTSGDKDV